MVLMTAYVVPTAACPSDTEQDSEKVRTLLQQYLRDSDDTTASYLAAFVNLKDDGSREVIVYFTNQYSCGTGGCNMLILVPRGSSYKVMTSVTIAWPPIRILKSKSHGWHDIGVWVQGGGIQPGYEGVLSYDSKKYPSNPTVPPAKPAFQKLEGETVIPELSKGMPVY
jgi:hypothetical protein